MSQTRGAVERELLQDILAQALGGRAGADSAADVLSSALEQLKLTADCMVHAAEAGALKTGHILLLRDRIEAVESFVDTCCSVHYGELGGDGPEAAE